MKLVFAKNVLRKYLLMIAVLLLFFAGGYRAFNIYSTYRSYDSEVEAIEKNTHTNIHNVLKVVIEEAHDVIEYKTKMESMSLHRLMIESMSIEDIYDNIVNMELGEDLILILNNVFDLSESNDKTIITVGTKDYVFFCKSNINSDDFDHLGVDSQYITWEEYYSHMNDPEIIKMAYEDLVMQRTDYVILRVDNVYPEGRYYNIEDVIQEYHENGMKNLDKYYMLTLGVITENGDIFGEPDDDYMKHNPNVNKLYIYRSVCLERYIKEYKPILDSFSQSMSAKIIQTRNRTEVCNGMINIFLVISTIIIIMVVIKSLDDENVEIQNKMDKPD